MFFSNVNLENRQEVKHRKCVTVLIIGESLWMTYSLMHISEISKLSVIYMLIFIITWNYFKIWISYI